MDNPAPVSTCQWLIDELERWAPRHWAEEWDNVGLLLGDATRDVKKVLVALDATEAVVHEAVTQGYDFLITHHPLIHDPLKKINTMSVIGRKIIALLQNGVNLYCAHTNLDRAPGGVNDRLFAKLRFFEAPAHPEVLINGIGDEPGLGLIGALPASVKLSTFVTQLKEALGLDTIRFSGNGDTPVRRVGLCAGDASHPRYWRAALEKNCDVYITGDLRYHGAQDAFEAGIALIDISHYAGEALIIDAVVQRLRSAAAAAGHAIHIAPTKTDGQIFSHY